MARNFNRTLVLLLILVLVVAASAAYGQESQDSAVRTSTVPRLINFGSVLKSRSGQSPKGVTAVQFALYKDQEGGAPLWVETQNLSLDDQGRYAVLLGSTKAEGLPMDLFASGESRWLGVRAQGEEEQARVLLVSVPYALKAADADTIGGKPLSAFVLTETLADQKNALGSTSSSSSNITKAGDAPTVSAVSGTGTVDKLPKWQDTNGALVDSNVIETGGNVGIGTT